MHYSWWEIHFFTSHYVFYSKPCINMIYSLITFLVLQNIYIIFVFLGICLGWICVHHQPDPPPRLGAAHDGQILGGKH